jgi:pimeloyl-ACP methyl ester carboxylesterase
VDLLMEKKENSPFLCYFSLSVTAIFLTILLLATSTIFISLGLINQNHIAIGQQQQELQNNQTSSTSSLTKQQQSTLEGISFNIDNMTFSHHMDSVNGIQLHYVIGGQGDPIVLLHGWPQTWYEWRQVMPSLAKNYTVIVPDLRGLGDSSKPVTGYDGNTTAEDIYQLVSQLGFNKIFLVAHDIGPQTAYSYAAVHPNNVSKLVIMDYIFAGFLPPEFGQNGPWWFAFHQVPNLPEVLVQGKEREYLSWFYKSLAYNPEAVTEADIDEFVRKYSAPGAMRAGFEYYRAFDEDAQQNKALVNQSKLQIPVLVLAGDIYPIAFGGDVPGNPVLNGVKALAENVNGTVVPLSGHWIPEEQPEFVIEQLVNFFGGNTTNANQ